MIQNIIGYIHFSKAINLRKSEASEMIKQFCETGNVEYLNQLSELARKKFILSCAHTLFQG